MTPYSLPSYYQSKYTTINPPVDYSITEALSRNIVTFFRDTREKLRDYPDYDVDRPICNFKIAQFGDEPNSFNIHCIVPMNNEQPHEDGDHIHTLHGEFFSMEITIENAFEGSDTDD